MREQESERFILPSLQLLTDIQRTGDIFFPKRWMDATLEEHRSRAAAKTVRDFLDGQPLPERLSSYRLGKDRPAPVMFLNEHNQ